MFRRVRPDNGSDFSENDTWMPPPPTMPGASEPSRGPAAAAAALAARWLWHFGAPAGAVEACGRRSDVEITGGASTVFIVLLALELSGLFVTAPADADRATLVLCALPCVLPHLLMCRGRIAAGMRAAAVAPGVAVGLLMFAPNGWPTAMTLLGPLSTLPMFALQSSWQWMSVVLLHFVPPLLVAPLGRDYEEFRPSPFEGWATLLLFWVIVALTRMQRKAVEQSASHMARDLRQSDEARRALEADSKAKMTFLATMSHELRTPLHATIGMSELLCESLAHDEQRDMAESVRSSSMALLGIINDVLDFTRIDAGGLTLTPAPTMLDEVLEQTATALHASAKPGVELCVDLHVPLGFSVSIDAVRLRQVLTNLTGNALKFTTQGYVIVRASVARDDPPPAGAWPVTPLTPNTGSERGPVSSVAEGDEVTILLSVEDTGCGIRPEEQGGIFDAFTQVQASTTREHDGTGLGLAISKQIVEQMGGTLALSSEEGRGSVFFARLPVAVTSALPLMPPTSVRVLLVLPPSQPTLCATLKRLLRSLNCRVLVAHAFDAEATSPRLGAGMDVVFTTAEAAVPPSMTAAGATVVRLVPPAGVRALPPGTLRVMLPARRLAVLRVLHEHVAHPERLATLGGNGPSSAVASLHGGGDGIAGATPPLVKRSTGLLEDSASVRLLVAEDNAVSRKVIRAMLERLGCDSTLVNDGEQAVNAFDAAGDGAFTAVLMDCHMPVMDGYEATRRIRALEAEREWRRTRIVALTADAFDGARAAALDSGMDDMATKPITMADLAKLLKRAVAAAQGGSSHSSHSSSTVASSVGSPAVGAQEVAVRRAATALGRPGN